MIPLTAVAALGSQVVVRTETPGERRVVASLFRNMREPVGPHPLESLALRHAKSDWIVSGGPAAEDLTGPLSRVRRELRERITRLFMNARPDFLWLHAAAVAKDGQAIIITGPGGSGKRMLAAELIAQGLDYLGDDVVPLDAWTRRVSPFPITPAVVVKRAQVATRPMRVAAIVFPRFTPGPMLARPVSPVKVALELLQQCRNFERHREFAVRALCAIAESTPALAVSFVDPTRAAVAIISLARGIT